MQKRQTDYFTYDGIPVKLVYDEGQDPWIFGESLAFSFDAGEFVPSPALRLQLWRGHNDVERLDKETFEAFIAQLLEILHLATPRYYIHNKLPIQALPGEGGVQVYKFNVETDEFDIPYDYYRLVSVERGEMDRVSHEQWEQTVREIRTWRDGLEIPKNYLWGKRYAIPVKLVRDADGRPNMLAYSTSTDSFAGDRRYWEMLIPPADPRLVEVSESELEREVRRSRAEYLEWKGKSKAG